MSINIVSSLDSGKIASLTEVFAIFMGLLIAANLHAIVGLAARRRLYSRGTARLSDSAWNVGVLEGIANPAAFLRDFRACLAFFLALVVICLEVLSVCETNASTSCSFRKASTWKVQKSPQKCFAPTPSVLSSFALTAVSFASSAKEKTKDVDLKVGIPTDTNVFEESIVSGKAVRQLKEGNYTKTYTAPVVDVFEITGNVSISNGLPLSTITVFPGSGKDTYAQYSELSCAFKDSSAEINSWTPTNPEFGNFGKNNSLHVTAATGFVDVQPCLANLVIRVCDYIGGRQDLPMPDVIEDLNFRGPGDESSFDGAKDDQTSAGAEEEPSLRETEDELGLENARGGEGSEEAKDGRISEGDGGKTSSTQARAGQDSTDAGGGPSSDGVADGQGFEGIETGQNSDSESDVETFVADDGTSVSVPGFLRQARPSKTSFEIQCKVHVIFREGRRTDASSILVGLDGAKTIDTATIRRGLLYKARVHIHLRSSLRQNQRDPCELHLTIHYPPCISSYI